MRKNNDSANLCPIFITGMPRSGTKLLRGLLNSHPKIRIPPDEPSFLPFWIKNWSKFDDLSIYSNFKKFYNYNIINPYFEYMKENNVKTDCYTWYSRCQRYDVTSAFESLIKLHLEINEFDKIIIGVKAPAYINNLKVIKKAFPLAKIIHIVRDVRDYCLSNKVAWKKNVLRSAHNWNYGVCKVEKDTAFFKKDFLNIKYEDLIENAEKELKNITDFIGIKYDKRMLNLKETTESIGKFAGTKKIQKKNYGKYIDVFEPNLVKKIESIAKNGMSKYHYTLQFDVKDTPLKKIDIYKYKMQDQINYIYKKIKIRGIKKTLKHELNSSILFKLMY